MTSDPTDDPFAQALHALLEGHCTPAVVRAVEQAGGVVNNLANDSADGQPGNSQAAKDLWQALDDSGFANAMVPESLGGAGLTLAQAFALLELCGRFAVPLPLAETMLVRAWAAGQGLEWPAACVGLDWVDAAAKDARLPVAPDTRVMRAAVLAAQMAGALQHVLAMTLQYANERQQFGRSLGKFQAIQHQLALMAEQTLAAHMAAQIGCAAATTPTPTSTSTPTYLPSRLQAGIAKARASEAAVVVTDLAHSIQGAIGFTEAFDLQLFTRRLHSWRQAAGAESYWHGEIGQALVHQHAGQALGLLRQATDARPHQN
jgi:acyl-CoA dehydrogenase